MSLPLSRLLDPVDGLAPLGEPVWEDPHEKADGAYRRRYEIVQGHVILTTWHGELHEVIYQTPADYEAGAASRNEELFAHYGDGHKFNELLDNGFGKSYRRADMERYALWSYVLDYTAVGTMEFHAVK